MTMLIDYNSFYYMFSLNDYRNSFLCSSFLADLLSLHFSGEVNFMPFGEFEEKKRILAGERESSHSKCLYLHLYYIPRLHKLLQCL